MNWWNQFLSVTRFRKRTPARSSRVILPTLSRPNPPVLTPLAPLPPQPPPKRLVAAPAIDPVSAATAIGDRRALWTAAQHGGHPAVAAMVAMLRLLHREKTSVRAAETDYAARCDANPILRRVKELRAHVDVAATQLQQAQRERDHMANHFEPDPLRFEGVFERYALAPEDIDRNYHHVLQPRGGSVADISPLTGRPVMTKWDYDPTTAINFRTLRFDGRACLLGAFLRLMVGTEYPRLDLASSTRKRLTYVVDQGVLDEADWKKALPHINAFLGGKWNVRRLDAVTVQLSRGANLPAVIPFEPRYLRRGQVFYGFDTSSGDPVYIPLAAMTHTLAVGQSGSGKSVFLNQVLLSLLFNEDLIGGLTLVDLKGGVELARYDGVIDKIRVITDYEALPEVVASLVALMRQRLTEMRMSACSSSRLAVPARYITRTSGSKRASTRRRFTTVMVTPNRLAICASVRPRLTSAANASCWSISSIGSRSRFSDKLASITAASSASVITMHGMLLSSSSPA
jgi:hypothetical protein